MKTLTAKVGCSCKLYKIGLLIGLIYLIPNLFILAGIFLNGYYDYTWFLLCAVTVLSSILLMRGLIEERHTLLLPWLVNTAVLIVFNIILLTVQFDEADHIKAKEPFLLEFGFLIGLEIQLLFWYIIYCLFKYGYNRSKKLNEAVSTISKDVETKGKNQSYYKSNLIDKKQFTILDKKIIEV